MQILIVKMKIIFDFPKNTFYLRVGMKQAALSRLLFVYYSEYLFGHPLPRVVLLLAELLLV